MRKIILSTIFSGFALFNCSIFAEDVTEPEVNIETGDQEDAKEYGGFYTGLGIGGSFIKNKAEGQNIEDNKSNRFMGTAVMGIGKSFKEKIYVGGEILADFSGSNSKEFRKDGKAVSDYQWKNAGITPGVAVRVGYPSKIMGHNCLAYLKAGADFPKTTIRNTQTGEEKKYDKAVASIFGGVEGAFLRDRLITRFEGGYRFDQKDNFNFNGQQVEAKTGGGVIVRLMVKCNVPFGIPFFSK